ncbi:hypothetical protein [Xanthomonas sacchari]|uniref:hypothetical protein n=1 Tax=Xanthomonas sacchari TaxID=56458 RepID=UPI002259B96C|nr:hypothetical protein [Xanthomonas sacchari]
MRTDPATNQHLRAWASAVVGDQVARSSATGTERLHVLDESAPLDPASSRVESIVRGMERSGRWKEARVLRTEYFLAGLTESDRLARMARLGLKISRASYYAYLASAHAFVAGALLFAVDHASSEQLNGVTLVQD